MAGHLHLYIIEGCLLAAFMLSACTWAVVLLHPGSPAARAVRRPLARRALMGVAMGTTAVVLITSPWGKLSGAHMNPAVTLAFALLGKVRGQDVAGYIAGQVIGGIVGVGLARAALGKAVAHPAVRFVVTEPGKLGWAAAAAGEGMISFVLFGAVLIVSNQPMLMAFTPLVAGSLVSMYILAEAPLSGMSMNPARTLASAVAARRFRALPVYLVVPPAAMSAAGLVYAAAMGPGAVHCAKMDHRGESACPFVCTVEGMRNGAGAPASEPGGSRHEAGFSRAAAQRP